MDKACQYTHIWVTLRQPEREREREREREKESEREREKERERERKKERRVPCPIDRGRRCARGDPGPDTSDAAKPRDEIHLLL